MNINEAVKPLIDPVLVVWNAIGYDVEEGIEACGEELDNLTAIESCLDADRLLLTGKDPTAHALCRKLCMEHGFSKVVDAVAKQVTLA